MAASKPSKPIESASKQTKPKPTYKHIPHSQKPPHLVAKRNARERRRVQAVNQAFYKLRKCVPIENRNKRVSKVKTLQRAIDHIRKLEKILAEPEQIDDEVRSSNDEQAQIKSNSDLTSSSSSCNNQETRTSSISGLALNLCEQKRSSARRQHNNNNSNSLNNKLNTTVNCDTTTGNEFDLRRNNSFNSLLVEPLTNSSSSQCPSSNVQSNLSQQATSSTTWYSPSSLTNCEYNTTSYIRHGPVCFNGDSSDLNQQHQQHQHHQQQQQQQHYDQRSPYCASLYAQAHNGTHLEHSDQSLHKLDHPHPHPHPQPNQTFTSYNNNRGQYEALIQTNVHLYEPQPYANSTQWPDEFGQQGMCTVSSSSSSTSSSSNSQLRPLVGQSRGSPSSSSSSSSINNSTTNRNGSNESQFNGSIGQSGWSNSKMNSPIQSNVSSLNNKLTTQTSNRTTTNKSGTQMIRPTSVGSSCSPADCCPNYAQQQQQQQTSRLSLIETTNMSDRRSSQNSSSESNSNENTRNGNLTNESSVNRVGLLNGSSRMGEQTGNASCYRLELSRQSMLVGQSLEQQQQQQQQQFRISQQQQASSAHVANYAHFEVARFGQAHHSPGYVNDQQALNGLRSTSTRKGTSTSTSSSSSSTTTTTTATTRTTTPTMARLVSGEQNHQHLNLRATNEYVSSTLSL